MAGLQLGLQIAFYLYPVGLVLALLSSQLISYRRRDAGKSAILDEKAVEKVERFYARLIRGLQLLLTPTLVIITPSPRSISLHW
jgi:hypothetical protein